MSGTGLTDPYLKLDWAKRHLEALDADLKIFHESKPCRFSSKNDLQNQRHILRVDLDDVPDHICLRCGDAFYCMRASLDQLAWRLARLTVTIPDRRTQFPIIENWDSDSLGRFRANLQGVPPDAIAIIRDLQPANSPAYVRDNLLWRLNAMCNLDKHRRIPANGSQVDFFLPEGRGADIVFEAFENHGTLSVPLAEKSKLDIHPQVTFQVVFGDITSGVSIGPEGIFDIYQFLSDSVLPRFVRFFT